MWSLVNSVVAIKVHAGCCCYGNRHPFWCRSNRLGRHPKKHLHDRQLHEKPNKISIKRSTCKIFKPYSWSIEGWSNHSIDVHTSHVYKLDQIPETKSQSMPMAPEYENYLLKFGDLKIRLKKAQTGLEDTTWNPLISLISHWKGRFGTRNKIG